MDNDMNNDMRMKCHVCGSINIAYVDTITDYHRPYLMVNVAYCKPCAMLIDRFEQNLSKRILGEMNDNDNC